MVVDGVTGRLVPPGDVTELAAALSQVLGDPLLAKAFGEAGRDRAREFTISAIVEQIEQIAFEPREQHLRLGVAEAAVELEQLHAALGDDEAAVEHAAVLDAAPA